MYIYIYTYIFIDTHTHTHTRTHTHTCFAGEELEIVKLLALLMPHITQPASLFTFTSYVYETFWLLMLLVKVEQGDIFAGDLCV